MYSIYLEKCGGGYVDNYTIKYLPEAKNIKEIENMFKNIDRAKYLDWTFCAIDTRGNYVFKRKIK